MKLQPKLKLQPLVVASETKVTTEIGERLAQIRGSISQAAFAKKTGVHKNTLGGYERGERTPDAEFLNKLIQLGYNSNWVITGTGSMMISDNLKEKPVDYINNVIDSYIYEGIIEDIVVIVEEVLAEKSVSLPPRKKASLIRSAVDLYKKSDKNERDAILMALIDATLLEGKI